MERRRTLITVIIALGVALSLRVGAADAQTITAPLDLSGVRPAVAVRIAGEDAGLWTFDTGAGGNVINVEQAQALNLPQEQRVRLGSPLGGTPIEAYLTTIRDVSIAGVALAPLRATVAPTLMPDRAGVLSPNAFAGRFVTFDFPRAELRITEKTTGATPHGEGYPYSADRHGMPSLPVRIGDLAFVAHIDSGAPGGLTLPLGMASQLQLTGPPAPAGRARFVDGERDVFRSQIVGEVRIGPLTLMDPEVRFIEGMPAGNIGMGLLRNLVVTLDPESRLTWISQAN